MRIVHLINTLDPKPSSDLYVAQPVTFETLKRAKSYAADFGIEVTHVTACFEEEMSAIPPWINERHTLRVSSLDFPDFADKRKLPSLNEIFEIAKTYSTDFDIFVYSNVDIGVQPFFYQMCAMHIGAGSDGFSVTRRTVPSEAKSVEELCASPGEKHPGDDCFVIKAELLQKFDVPQVFSGVAWFDRAVLLNCAVHATSFERRTDDYWTFHIGEDQSWSNAKASTIGRQNAKQIIALIERLEAEFGKLYNIDRVWNVFSNGYRVLGLDAPQSAPKLKQRIRGLMGKKGN